MARSWLSPSLHSAENNYPHIALPAVSSQTWDEWRAKGAAVQHGGGGAPVVVPALSQVCELLQAGTESVLLTSNSRAWWHRAGLISTSAGFPCQDAQLQGTEGYGDSKSVYLYTPNITAYLEQRGDMCLYRYGY